MPVIAVNFPAQSLIDKQSVADAAFSDSYSVESLHPDMNMPSIFFGIFGHNPWWIKAALLARNALASLFGLDVPPASDIRQPKIRAAYEVGDTMGPWPIFALTETEVIAGRDNKHLDFRMSILKQGSPTDVTLVVSTVCNVHNLFGTLYLSAIVPFHKWGVQRLLRAAHAAGRV